MKISKIIVNNYRSIQSAKICPGKFSVFVGQNNHGKTNFFESIEWFYTAKSSKIDEYFNRNEKVIISVELFFEDVLESDIEKLTTDANKTKIRTVLGQSKSFSVLKTSVKHKRSYFVCGEDKGNPGGLDSAINEFLPKLEYVNTKVRLDDVSKYKDKNPIGIMLSGVLTAIIESSQDYIDFKDQFSKLFDHEDSEVRKKLDELGLNVEVYLQKQFPDGTKVKFNVNPPKFNDLLKSFDTIVDDGILTKAEDKGDGMQRAIMLSIIQAFADYRKAKSGGGSFLFLLDEAELHLHPSAQRSLTGALADICNTDQVFVNTHSSVLVTDERSEQTIFKVEKNDMRTSIKPIETVDEKMDVIFDLLGGSPYDLLLPKNFIIVEGQSEYEFLNIIKSRFYQDKYNGIKVIFARGDMSREVEIFHAIHNVYKPLFVNEGIYKKTVVIVCDLPNASNRMHFDTFMNSHKWIEKGV